MAHEGGRQSDSIDPASFSSLGLSDARPSRGAVTGQEATINAVAANDGFLPQG